MAVNNRTLQLVPIGTILTPYNTLADCPRNTGQTDAMCRVRVFEEYGTGLDGLKPGDRVELLYWLDQAVYTELIRTSRKSGERKGIFALRTPHRPNPIGTAVVGIESRTDLELTVQGLDCLSGTPLLDIKPAFQGKNFF